MLTRSSANGCSETGIDPVAEVLNDFRLSGSYYCRSELRAPWGLEFPEPGGAGFHFVAEGNCYLRREGEKPLLLEAGDLVLLPRGGGLILSDQPKGAAEPITSLDKETIGQNASLLREGGDGLATTLVSACVRFDDSGLHPLFDLMPDLLHVDGADCSQDETLQAMVTAMGAEAISPRAGGATVMTRLADILVVQAVRWWLDQSTEECFGWLRALRDPQVGPALALIHRRPEESWTLDTLAKAIHISRSVFSERFTELVGMPPMHYLARRRMSMAWRWLREDKLAIGQIATRLGYASEPSFSRAFKRHTGVSPGAARRDSQPAGSTR